MRYLALALIVLLSNAAFAAEPAPISPSGGLLQIATALLFVLGLVFAAAWLMRRLGPMNAGNKIPVKIIGGINVGNRERVMVVEVGDQWLILGVTANNINKLGSMPKQDELLNQSAQTAASDPFSTWLKRTLDKRTTERSDNS
ncbi:flagellar biosynthetic protein FliO [Undibacterium umbellatum]|uniref:Flagellar protein n=1 Tax=Undibacterium umbellatum TaxID=2762300 RepID=A0ABR6ZBJ4_9BURK|nr:flagellar biosynthetic protein FliO [Undibacterium umbellatum]MBC3909135.1 flagellar biosynthetic protein FliO [Undibacterium umbellatum]